VCRDRIFREAGEADILDQFGHGFVALGFGDAVDFEAVGDVVLDGEPWKRGVLLKDHAAVAAGLDDVLAADQDVTAVGVVEAGDEAQDGRFAATRGAEEDAEFADVVAIGGEGVFDIEVDVVDGLDLLAAGGVEAPGDVAEGDFGVRGHGLPTVVQVL
jgi:hypothetical protein